MNRRLIGLLLAIVLAGVATFLLIQYVTSADERAREDEALAEVFVATADIPAGTPAETAAAQGLIDQSTVPARSVPAGAIGSLDAIAGQVATMPLFEGEVIVSQRFGSTVAATTDATLEVPEGLLAISVQAGVVPGVAGFVQPQDTVSIVASLVPPEDEVSDDDDDAEPAESGQRTEFLVQNVPVLAVGQRVITTAEDGSTSASIQLSNESYIFTLGMTAEQVEQLVFASQQGELWFTLLPEIDEDEEREVFDTPGRTIGNIFDN